MFVPDVEYASVVSGSRVNLPFSQTLTPLEVLNLNASESDWSE
jgi:hypothetical protein